MNKITRQKQIYDIKYRKLNKEKISKRKKYWWNKNKEKMSIRKKKYYQLNKIKINNHIKYKLHTNIRYRLSHILRTRIGKALKRNSKSETTIKLLGCNVGFLKNHLEKKFKRGMSWSNYGKWHVDHIKPCASFDMSKVSEQRKCFNYTNLQPLWAIDNIRKGKNEK
jgi:hypothetical protein